MQRTDITPSLRAEDRRKATAWAKLRLTRLKPNSHLCRRRVFIVWSWLSSSLRSSALLERRIALQPDHVVRVRDSARHARIAPLDPLQIIADTVPVRVRHLPVAQVARVVRTPTIAVL